MVTVRFALLVGVLFAAPALAEGIEGMGRISVVGGYKWTPNGYFEGKAAQAGHPLTGRTPGIEGSASFGYGVNSFAEVAIDLFGGWETFTLDGYQPFSSTIYGGLIGLRVTSTTLFGRSLVPHLGAQAGPAVAQITSPSFDLGERVLLAATGNIGVTWRFVERFGITLDVRYMYARLFVADISGANIGGVFFSIGATMYFPGSPERKDLSVPGF